MRVLVRSAFLTLLGVSLAACGSVAAGSPAAAPRVRPLDVLRVPSGATPWKSDGDAPLGLGPFVRDFYTRSAWSQEKVLYGRRRFESGTIQGWVNADGSQQSIAVARFASVQGARSAFRDLADALTADPAKTEAKVTDPVDGAAGIADSQPDSLGNDKVDLAAPAGDCLVDVHEYTPGKPDPDAAAALLRQQVAALKAGD